MKYTLITGASSGIGKATAITFAAKGKNLILVARRKQHLEQLKSDLTSKYDIDVVVKPFDLSDLQQVYQLYEECKMFDIEVWVNNAGLGLQSKITDQDIDKVMNILRVNIEALTVLSTLFVQDNKDKDATIINVSSTAGYGITSRLPIYSCSKLYISAFTEALYWELKNLNLPMCAKVMAAGSTISEFEITASGKPLDLNHFKGNTSEEVGDFIYQLYKSDKALGYVEEENYTLVLSDPKLPHTFNKTEIPNLLKR